jgi:hypothetical protein
MSIHYTDIYAYTYIHVFSLLPCCAFEYTPYRIVLSCAVFCFVVLCHCVMRDDLWCDALRHLWCDMCDMLCDVYFIMMCGAVCCLEMCCVWCVIRIILNGSRRVYQSNVV